jgi:peptide/nickel transport system permease protein
LKKVTDNNLINGQQPQLLLKRPLTILCLAIISSYFLLAAFVYVAELTRWNPRFTQWDKKVGAEYESPNEKNILGTDYLGRSVLRKTIYGAKVSLTVALFASFIGIIIAVPLGALAGFYHGIVDDIVVWLCTTLTSIPYILLILAFALVLKDKSLDLTWLGLGQIPLAGTPAVCIALGFTGWVGICRLVRAEVIKQKQLDYARTARSFGCSNFRILFRHILPNLYHILIISFSIRFAYYIHAEVILSFLGLGVKNAPSWGTMIDLARQDLTKGCWWEMTSATAALFVISLAINIFGDTLRDTLNPKFIRLQRIKYKVTYER